MAKQVAKKASKKRVKKNVGHGQEEEAYEELRNNK